MKKSFLKIFSVITVAVTIISCDKDFNTVGSDVIGDDHFNLEKVDYDVVAYNKATGPVQTNNLTVNAFGVYENPAFGATTGVTAFPVPSSTVTSYTFPLTVMV